jgi:hypothetical protein
MTRPTKKMLVSVAAFGAAGSLAFTGAALAHDGHHGKGQHHGHHHKMKAFSLDLAPSHVGDPTLAGATAGGKDWALDEGTAKVKADGRFKVKVEGLVFPDTGSTSPAPGAPAAVTTVSASLFCTGTLVGTTAAAPLSANGNAKITGQFTLPTFCASPLVLVHPNGNTAVYIAFSGFRL